MFHLRSASVPEAHDSAEPVLAVIDDSSANVPAVSNLGVSIPVESDPAASV